MVKIKRVLISVFNKDGLADFAKEIVSYGAEIVSTGGTAKALKDAGLKVEDVSNVTGFPEMLGGRVKTLHPAIHGGLLAIRGNKEHEEAIAKHKIKPIDMVVVNLYPFESVIKK